MKIALKLYDAGFNVVPVGADKRPLCEWGSRKRIPHERLEQLLDKARSIAVVGGPENPWKPTAALVIVDVDDPRALDKSPALRSVIESTVAWRTGPRCPKCGEKHVEVLEPGSRFKCSKCSTEFTLEEALRGIGALITVDNDTAEKYFRGTVRAGNVEFLVNNYALIPPSIHPTGVKYEWIKRFNFEASDLGVRALVESEVESLLEELGILRRGVEEKEVAKPPVKLRELADSEIIKVKELLKPAYKAGNRQHIWLFLSGWAAKAGISPISVARILKMLYEETGDTDPIKTRASSIATSYKKAGIDLSQYASEIEELFGVKPYGLEKGVSEEEVKGKTGLQEILESSLEEEKALSAIEEIEEVFKAASPYRDCVFRILDSEKKIYAIANLRKLEVVRARKKGEGFTYMEHVFIGAPTSVFIIENPIDNSVKYRVIWETRESDKPLELEGTPPEILGELRGRGLVLNRVLAEDILNAILDAYRISGRAEKRKEVEACGFFIMEGKLVAVNVEVKQPSVEELREALLLLNELAGKWFNHVIDRFARHIRWSLLAPFIYAYKQLGRWVKWRYLYGVSHTGKTTLGEITLRIWGLGPEYMKSGTQIDTVPRLGEVISKSTFPIVVNEPGGALSKEEIREMLKSAIESPVARGVIRQGVYKSLPALAPIVLTTNKHQLRDDALLRRLEVEVFTYGERIKGDKARVFEKTVKPQLVKLRALGDFAAFYALNNGLPENYEELPVRILEEAYRQAGLTPPEWIHEKRDEDSDFYEEIKETIRGFLLRRINEEYNRSVGRVVVETSSGFEYYSRSDLGLEERVKVVLDKGLIPWLTKSGDYVFFTTDFARELAEVIGDIGGLKSIAELLGWEYRPKHPVRKGKTVTSYTVIRAPLEDFLDFLEPPSTAE